MGMIITTTMRIYRVSSRNSFAIIAYDGSNYEVIYCTNMEKCRMAGIVNCPPFCEKISELKKFIRFGRCRLKVVEITEQDF
ncbi:hypothetical protein [Archaeoglobus sp.]